MLDRLIAASIRRPGLVVAAALLLAGYGAIAVGRMPVDVLPDLNRPTVNVLTEAPGLAPEEVERTVTAPLELALVGAPGVQRVRSTSGIGLSAIAVEFEWGEDVYRTRQIVAEKLQLAAERLPRGVSPSLGPISSLMGEIMLLGLESDGGVGPLELRSIADARLRPRLLAVPGVAQVIPLGGGAKQVQVVADPARLSALSLTLDELADAVLAANSAAPGGFMETGADETIVRSLGRIASADALLDAPLVVRGGLPVALRQVADVRVGARPPRGDAGVDGRPGVILTVLKQPGANTVELTRAIERALDDERAALPPGVRLRPLFEQSRFIRAAVGNVEEALVAGAVLVVIVLVLFLMNARTTIITLTAIPLSLLTTAVVLGAFGVSINTMTLGGFAIAIGELVDDAIVDVENVFRRLRENRRRAESDRAPAARVVYEASREVRNAIVFATLLVGLAFLPLFALGGIEGRLFAPLAVAYLTAIAASFVVSLTVTPALCLWLLPNAKAVARERESWVVRALKAVDRRALERTLPRPGLVIAGAALLVAAAATAVPFLGREFLPPFNEGSATIGIVAAPGTSLAESARIGVAAEKLLRGVPEVVSTGRRTGRAELDEHAEGVNVSEVEVEFRASKRSSSAVLADCRARLAALPGVTINVGQPISHRLDHLLSGVRAQVAVKLFGDDLAVLRAKAAEAAKIMAGIPGVVDLEVERQTPIPQLRIEPDRAALARHGMRAEDLTSTVEAALSGRVVTQVFEDGRPVDVVVRLGGRAPADADALGELLVQTAAGRTVPLSAVARIERGSGPSTILHENGRRRIVVSANVGGRDLSGTVREIRARLARDLALPPGTSLVLGGQFESQESATRVLSVLGVLAVIAMAAVLYAHFRSAALVAQVLLSIPLALVGSVIAVALAGGTLSVASLVGFITLTGIASRNTILMIAHYLHLMREEGMPFGRELVIRGSLERLVPVLMTAGTALLALLPIALSHGEPGREILEPVARVIVGGLVSATLLDTLVTPAVFLRFGRRAAERHAASSTGRDLLS